MPKKDRRQEALNAAPGAEQGAQTLYEQGHVDQAAAVRTLIGYLTSLGFDSGPTTNLQLYMDKALAEHFLAKASTRSELTVQVQRGFDLFLAGHWEPEGPIPSNPRPRGGGTTPKSALSVTVLDEVVDQVAAKAAKLAKARGWSRMDKAGRIAIAYLIHVYGLPKAYQTAVKK